MDLLRERLRAASTAFRRLVPSIRQTESDPALPNCERLATIGPGLIAFLVDDSKIFVFNTTSTGSEPQLLELDQPLPAGSYKLIAAPTEHGTFAVCANRGIAVVECANNGASAQVRFIGTSMFRRRPGLQVLHTAWSPHADAFLALLTTDGNLRLFDVSSKKSAEVERFRLRVVTSGAGPVSFAFGRANGWDCLSVYVLAEDGAMYVASPVAPVGTRIPTKTWKSLYSSASSALEKDAVDEDVRNVIAGDSAGKNEPPQSSLVQTPAPENLAFGFTPKRQLDFSTGAMVSSRKLNTGDDNVPSNAESWTNMQAEMQIRFLKTVFDTTHSTDEMVVVREFKPAPLLFQGPFYVERDDALDLMDDYTNSNDAEQTQKFVHLTLMQHGYETPPVFLRTTSAGETSVLISLEAVEAQWFLGDGSQESRIEANYEYSECARTSAPNILCFEHLSFPGQAPVQLFPLPGKIDCNVLFAVVGALVYSVRLPFLSVINDPVSLQDCPPSSIAPLLDVRNIETERPSEEYLLGLAQSFERGIGPIAIVMSKSYVISATPPLRWTVGVDHNMLSSIIDPKPGAEMSWNNKRPLSGNRAFACKTGREVMEAMQDMRMLDERQGWNVADGTLTSLNNANSISSVLSYLETRIAAYTGSKLQSGVGDIVKSSAALIVDWTTDLEKQSRSNIRCAKVVQDEFQSADISSNVLRRKLDRAAELNENLRDRIEVLREIVESGAGLSAAERERQLRLKEKKRRMLTLRKRLSELEAAVEAMKKLSEETRSRRALSTMTPGRYSTGNQNGWTGGNPAWRSSGSPWRTSGHRGWEDWGATEEPISLANDELKKIKNALENHGTEITECQEAGKALWDKLSVM